MITCIDPRVEPAAIVGSELGETIIARNVGGRVTSAVIKGCGVDLARAREPDP